jgi:hypothetical protein
LIGVLRLNALKSVFEVLQGHGRVLHYSGCVTYTAGDLGEDESMNSGQFRKGELHGKQFPRGEHHEIKTGKTWRHVTAPLTDRRQRGGYIKLTRRDVELIRQDSRSLVAIAREYGVGRTTIWNAKHRVSYKHVP